MLQVKPKLIFYLILSGIMNCFAVNKRPDNPPYIWGDLIFGKGNMFNDTKRDFLFIGAKVNLEYKLLYSIEAFAGKNCLILCEVPNSRVEYNVLIGKGYPLSYFSIYGNIGIGFVNGKKSDYCYDNGIDERCYSKQYHSVGMPIEFGVQIARKIGIGLMYRYNVNNHVRYHTFSINIPIGEIN